MVKLNPSSSNLTVEADSLDTNLPRHLPLYKNSSFLRTFSVAISLLHGFILLQPSIASDRNLSLSLPISELANDIEGSPEEDSSSALTGDAVSIVHALYDTLRSRDADTVHHLLAPDLEWWFHGPPSHQYLMRLLTGSPNEQGKLPTFTFVPETVTSFGPLVIAEGCDEAHSIFWVHAWTVSDDGVITRVREYFNTSLTVTHFGRPKPSSEITSDPHRNSVWESSLSDQAGKSVPGLVLAL